MTEARLQEIERKTREVGLFSKATVKELCKALWEAQARADLEYQRGVEAALQIIAEQTYAEDNVRGRGVERGVIETLSRKISALLPDRESVKQDGGLQQIEQEIDALRGEVVALRSETELFVRDIALNYDHDADAHRRGLPRIQCRACKAQAFSDTIAQDFPLSAKLASVVAAAEKLYLHDLAFHGAIDQKAIEEAGCQHQNYARAEADLIDAVAAYKKGNQP